MPELSPETWAQIRYEYEHTDRPIADICAERGISTTTSARPQAALGLAPRRAPIPARRTAGGGGVRLRRRAP